MADSYCTTTRFVVPILCYSRTIVSYHEPVGRAEIVSLGFLNHVIANRPEVYSPQEVRIISRFLEKRLGTSPATRLR